MNDVTKSEMLNNYNERLKNYGEDMTVKKISNFT